MAWISWVESHSGFIELIAAFLVVPLMGWVYRVHRTIKKTIADCETNSKDIVKHGAEVTLMRSEFARKEDLQRLQQDVLRVERQANSNHAETNKTMEKLFERVDKIDRGVARIVGHLCGPDGDGS